MKIGNNVELDPRAEQYISEHEAQIQEALRLYYDNFTGVGDGITFNDACHRNGMSPYYVICYRVMHDLGVPDTKEEAQECLHILEKLTTPK